MHSMFALMCVECSLWVHGAEHCPEMCVVDFKVRSFFSIFYFCKKKKKKIVIVYDHHLCDLYSPHPFFLHPSSQNYTVHFLFSR